MKYALIDGEISSKPNDDAAYWPITNAEAQHIVDVMNAFEAKTGEEKLTAIASLVAAVQNGNSLKGTENQMNYAVFNPHGKPVDELPFIYGFNNGESPGWFSGVLLAEDGTPLGGHLCSHEYYMLGDLGITEGSRPDRHEDFQKHYPDGYRMDFVTFDDVRSHEGLSKAIDIASAREPDEEGTTNGE